MYGHICSLLIGSIIQNKYQVLENKSLQDTTIVLSTTDDAGSMLSVNEMSCPLPNLFQDDVTTILHPYFEFIISVSNDGSSFVSVESKYTYLVYDAACVNCTGNECHAVVSPGPGFGGRTLPIWASSGMLGGSNPPPPP